VNLPEFLLHQLGGRRVSEYTNATHTQLLGVQDQAWCPEIFAAAGLDLGAAPPLVRPGTTIGESDPDTDACEGEFTPVQVAVKLVIALPPFDLPGFDLKLHGKRRKPRSQRST
jgi:sugar (pentulose or hexulose) kinase